MIFPPLEQLLFLDIETVREYKYLNEKHFYQVNGDKSPLLNKKNKKEVFEFSDIWGYNLFQDTYKKMSYLGSELSQEDYYEQMAGLLPAFGKIVCITIGYMNNGELKPKTFSSHNEKILLTEFATVLNHSSFFENKPVSWQDAKLLGGNKSPFLQHSTQGVKEYNLGDGGWTIKSPRFLPTGQNIDDFDLPYIWKRCIKNSIKPPSSILAHPNTPKYQITSVDTQKLFNYNAYRGAVSLETQCWLANIDSPKNGEVSGKEVGDCYYHMGKFADEKNGLELISRYCEKDVQALVDYIKYCNSLV